MIIVRLKGGLGNQMFQYATALALASKHGTELKLDLTLLEDDKKTAHLVKRDFELGNYTITASIASAEERARFNPQPSGLGARLINKVKKALSPPNLYLEPSHAFDPRVMELSDDHCIVGAFQSAQYFSSIRERVQKEFNLRSALPQKASAAEQEIKNVPASVALHIRRGDYVSNPLFSQLLGALPLSYYEKAIARIKEEVKGPLTIFVFSDDMPWCKENLKTDVPLVFMDQSKVENDAHAQLYLMRQCKAHIISNSSYSWWGAWLAQSNAVVAPKQWFANNERDGKDIIPGDWIKI